MKRKFVFAAAILIAVSLIVGFLLANLAIGQNEQINHYSYSLSLGPKTYTVTVKTNWNTEPAPEVSLHSTPNSTERFVELYFWQGKQGTIFYNITIPTAILSGNISLVWKYYLQNADRYTLVNNGTHNSLSMTFAYDPHFSGNGYFEIKGTGESQ